jgi:hypothetical protein
MTFAQRLWRSPPGATPPPRPEHEHYRHGEISLGPVLDQDAHNLPRVQRVNSKAFPGTWINDTDGRIRHMHRVIDDYLFGPDR